MMKVFLALLFSLFFYNLSLAQPAKFGAWYNYFGSMKLAPRFNLHHEVQYRNYDFGSDLEQLMLRTGIGYNLTENNNNILLGYGYIHSENYTGFGDGKTGFGEHRIFQQFITKQHFGRVYMQHRFRLEERFVNGDDVRFRGRYFLSFNIALNNKSLVEKTFYLSAYNEVFLARNVYNWIGGTETVLISFDRNRAYGGVGYKLNDNLKFELAYMNQYGSTNNQRDQINVACFFNF